MLDVIYMPNGNTMTRRMIAIMQAAKRQEEARQARPSLSQPTIADTYRRKISPLLAYRLIAHVRTVSHAAYTQRPALPSRPPTPLPCKLGRKL